MIRIDLSKRTAIVTGGAKGIGLGIAQRLSDSGAALLDIRLLTYDNSVQFSNEVMPMRSVYLRRHEMIGVSCEQ